MRPSDVNGSSPLPTERVSNGTLNGLEAQPMTPRERDGRIQKERLLDRLGKRKSIGTPSSNSPINHRPTTTPGRALGATPGPGRVPPKPLSNDELLKNYELALAKFAQNQINQKTAFNDNFMDIFPQFSKNALAESDQANYKILSGVLELGTAHYACRVDNVHSEAQRVASGLTMALGDKGKSKSREDGEGNEDVPAGEQDEEEVQRQKKKREKARRIKTVAENPESLNQARTEMSVEDHPLIKRLERFRSSQEETSVRLLLLTHLELGVYCDLMLDSATVRDKPLAEMSLPPGKVSLRPFSKVLNNIDSDSNIHICPSITRFDFGDRETSHWETETEVSDLQSQRFDMDQPYNDDLPGDSFCGGDGIGFDENSNDAPLANQSVRPRNSLQAMNVDDYLNLIKQDATDYTFVDSRLLNAWAGPTHWKMNALAKFQAMKAAAAAASLDKQHNDDGGHVIEATTASRRSKRIEYRTVDFDKGDLTKLRSRSTAKSRKTNTKLSASTLCKWDEKAKDRAAYIPHDHSYSVLSLLHPHLLPEYTFHCDTKTVEEVNDSIRDDHDYDQVGSPRNFDPDDMDDELDFADTDQLMEEPPVSMDGILAGDQLIENPWTSQMQQIGYATQAKRIDVKQLKSALWKVVTKPKESISTPERNQTNGEAPEKSARTSEEPIRFTALYSTIKTGEIPMSRVVPNHVSFPIAFCTLLHLVNEHSLQLEPQKDLCDFTIKLSDEEISHDQH